MPAYINKQGYIRVTFPGFDKTKTEWRGQRLRNLSVEEKTEICKMFDLMILSGHSEEVKMWFPKERAKYLIKKVAYEWLEHKYKRPSTIAQQKDELDRYVIPELGDKSVKELTRQDCYWIRERWGDTAMAHTVRSNFQAFLNWCWKEGMMDRQIFVPVIVVPAKPTPHIEIEDRWRIWDAVDGQVYRNALLLSIEMGLRVGEIVALKWDCVDLDRGVLKILRSLSKYQIVEMRKGGDEYWLSLDMPFIVKTKAMLIELKKHRKTHWVFAGQQGKHLWTEVVSTAFKKAARRCGLPQAQLHHCRHSFGHDRLDEHYSLEEIQAFYGHRSRATTERYLGRGRALGVRRLRRVEKLRDENIKNN